MIRHILTALLAALALTAWGHATAQPTNAATPDAPTDTDLGLITSCIGAQIAVGAPGADKIEIDLAGGSSCALRVSPKALRATIAGNGLEIRDHGCPPFVRQATMLKPSRERARQVPRTPAEATPPNSPIAIQAGPFAIRDWAGYFKLQTPDGRRAAARWVRHMLDAVRPCWVGGPSDGDDVLAFDSQLVHRLYQQAGLGSFRASIRQETTNERP